MTDVRVRRAAGARPSPNPWSALLLGGCVLLLAAPALGKPLDQLIPDLFGGSLSTTNDETASDFSNQQALIVQKFRDLSAQLSVARSQVPIPSSGSAFSFAWDSELDTFVRFEQSLGSIFAERAQTLGRGHFSIGFAYQHVGYDTLNGESLDHIQAVQPAFTTAYLDTIMPPEDRPLYATDTIDSVLNMSFSFDLFYLTAAYGLTDSIDVSMALTINRAALSGSAVAMTLTGVDPSKVAFFSPNQQGAIFSGGTPPICNQRLRCAADSFDQTAVGTGDLFLRGKWHITDTRYADLAVAGVLTLPTGNADDFLGFHDPTFTPWAIASKRFGWVAPHLNVGYAIRSGTDVSQFQWIAGADVLATSWLTPVADFLGYYDHVNHNVVQSAVGFKVNPVGGLVLSVGFQFPVNRDGLRADVIYTGQVEYNF